MQTAYTQILAKSRHHFDARTLPSAYCDLTQSRPRLIEPCDASGAAK
jgi:hypothetical protein